MTYSFPLPSYSCASGIRTPTSGAGVVMSPLAKRRREGDPFHAQFTPARSLVVGLEQAVQPPGET